MKARSTRLLAEFRWPRLCDGRPPPRSGPSNFPIAAADDGGADNASRLVDRLKLAEAVWKREMQVRRATNLQQRV